MQRQFPNSLWDMIERAEEKPNDDEKVALK